MLPAGLDAIRRDRPDGALAVNLFGARPCHLARPGRRKDQELERLRCQARLLLEVADERADLIEGQGGCTSRASLAGTSTTTAMWTWSLARAEKSGNFPDASNGAFRWAPEAMRRRHPGVDRS